MKKFLFYFTVMTLLLGVLSCTSCKPNHDNLNDGRPSYLNYEFSVDDQINVQQYEIEVSLTGNVDKPEDWTTAGMLLANTGGLTHKYTLQVEVTRWFKEAKIIYSRIKSIDLDGKVQYSTISTTKNGS